jgi:hypothetical protein
VHRLFNIDGTIHRHTSHIHNTSSTQTQSTRTQLGASYTEFAQSARAQRASSTWGRAERATRFLSRRAVPKTGD